MNNEHADTTPSPAPPPPAAQGATTPSRTPTSPQADPGRTATGPPTGGELPEGLISGALRDGWQALKHDPIVLIGFFLLKVAFTVLILWILSGGILGEAIYHDEGSPFYGFREMFIAGIASLIDNLLSVGMLCAALRIVRREDTPFLTLFAAFKKFVPVIVVYVVVKVMVGFGILLFVIPGIIIALGFSQWALLIMDRNAGILSSLEGSWQMMRGYKAEFLLLWIVLIAINVLGVLPLGIGLILTVPFTYAVQAAFYNRVLALNPPQLAA